MTLSGFHNAAGGIECGEWEAHPAHETSFGTCPGRVVDEPSENPTPPGQAATHD